MPLINIYWDVLFSVNKYVCIVCVCVNARYFAMLPSRWRSGAFKKERVCVCVLSLGRLAHCYFSFLPSCMALLFTEIVNQLNALSCLHGDDDDDDGGVLKRARKAAAKPAASSQGLFSPFSPRVPDSYQLVNIVSSSQPFIATIFFSIYLFFLIRPFSASPLSLPLSLLTLVLWTCCGPIYLGPYGNVLYMVL